MKYFILVPDGCSDWAIESLGGKTPLETADISNINALAKVSETGLVRTVPVGMEPGSDAANLSLLGYNPAECLTGRAPLEAAAMGIEMREDETAIRTNFVTLDGEIIVDHSAGELENEDAEILIKFIDEKLGSEDLRFYPGVSYRCLLIAKNAGELKAIPPHDILGKNFAEYFPQGDEIYRDLMRRSHELLKNHPLNIERMKNGKPAANSVWFWGQGKKMSLFPHKEKYGVKGCMVTAVNLLKGIAYYAGFSCPDIPGATGTIHTNYEGKAQAAIEAFKNGEDFVFLHVEAPDECSHCGDLDGKIKSMEYIDKKIFAAVYDYLKNCGEPFRILVLPDHKTPLEIRTHTDEPIPFILFNSGKDLVADETKFFSENGVNENNFFESGSALAEYFFRK
ncbi:MAG: cofactor-independent phosphoglycerate mutase [Clostridiales bacterium]|jgi:2,3-bisphosphoglycerate-independent phosphoglycerate mutase|nr:cofactor-independent phosphoglycerate mutase [Clostridiales bacterium]